MLKHKGKKYSREQFDDYKYRGRVSLEITEVKNHMVVRRETNIDVYTTNSNQKDVRDVLLERSSENVTKLEITWWSTREQDEAASALIEEWLEKND